MFNASIVPLRIIEIKEIAFIEDTECSSLGVFFEYKNGQNSQIDKSKV
jgi:hypothetical protein